MSTHERCLVCAALVAAEKLREVERMFDQAQKAMCSKHCLAVFEYFSVAVGVVV